MAILDQLKKLKKNIRIGIIGTGFIGRGLFHQCSLTPGIECVALADLNLNRCIASAELTDSNYQIVNHLSEIDDTIQQGSVAICQDGALLAKSESIDVLIESSNSINEAAQFIITAIEHQKHIVLVNAEVDLIFGPYFLSLAQKYNVIYTSADGDQHTVIKHLINELQLWGLDLVMAGNIKGFLNLYATPTSIIPEADKRKLDYAMAAAFTDGTKLSVEMALVANSLGLLTLIPGMHGPKLNHVTEVLDSFDFATLWKNKQPFVDYIIGAEPGGGVFAVGYCDDPYQKEKLAYYKMGQGPFYLLYRPYHLCHIETLMTVAEAVLNKTAVLQPTLGFQTNVYAHAKRNLRQGETLDGIGGYTCYGLIENASKNQGLPICLAENIILNRSILKDEKIKMVDVDYSSNKFGFDLYFKCNSVS